MRKSKLDTKHYIVLILKTSFVFFIFLLVFLYTLPAYNSVKAFFEDEVMTDNKIIIVGDTPVTIEIADTLASRTQGLSGRAELKEGRGLFFIFDSEYPYGFWMKDMNFAIDILWFNSFGELIYIKENATPESYPETFTPPSPALYVLEVPQGFVSKNHIRVGDKIDFY